MHRPRIELKRIYERPEPDDGLRALVDRLWPRGRAGAAMAGRGNAVPVETVELESTAEQRDPRIARPLPRGVHA